MVRVTFFPRLSTQTKDVIDLVFIISLPHVQAEADSPFRSSYVESHYDLRCPVERWLRD